MIINANDMVSFGSHREGAWQTMDMHLCAHSPTHAHGPIHTAGSIRDTLVPSCWEVLWCLENRDDGDGVMLGILRVWLCIHAGVGGGVGVGGCGGGDWVVSGWMRLGLAWARCRHVGTGHAILQEPQLVAHVPLWCHEQARHIVDIHTHSLSQRKSMPSESHALNMSCAHAKMQALLWNVMAALI